MGKRGKGIYSATDGTRMRKGTFYKEGRKARGGTKNTDGGNEFEQEGTEGTEGDIHHKDTEARREQNGRQKTETRIGFPSPPRMGAQMELFAHAKRGARMNANGRPRMEHG
jgi:hypothetical protein